MEKLKTTDAKSSGNDSLQNLFNLSRGAPDGGRAAASPAEMRHANQGHRSELFLQNCGVGSGREIFCARAHKNDSDERTGAAWRAGSDRPQRLHGQQSVVDRAEFVARNNDGFAAQRADQVKGGEAFTERREQSAGAFDQENRTRIHRSMD